MAQKKTASSTAAKAATSPVADSEGRVRVNHGPFLIVAGPQGEGCAAVGYLGNKRVGAASAPTVDEAMADLKQSLDKHSAELRAERVDGVPTETEYREAFDAIYPKLPKRMKAMLATHCRLPDAATTLVDLARRFDVSERTVSADYAKLGRGLSGLLDFSPDTADLDRKLLPLLSVATLDRTTESGQPILRLRGEVVGALRTRQQIES